jgi:hypothetical protein
VQVIGYVPALTGVLIPAAVLMAIVAYVLKGVAVHSAIWPVAGMTEYAIAATPLIVIPLGIDEGT